MIYEVLSEIQSQLNQHFKLRFGLSEDKLHLSTIVNNDGTAAIENDLVVMMPINIQEEKHLYNRNSSSGSNPSVSLNMLILFTNTFVGQSASEGLKFLSETVSFFLQNNNMDIEGNNIAIEFFNLDINAQNSLWASLGAKYAPSVVYKLSLINITEDMPTSEITFASDFPDE